MLHSPWGGWMLRGVAEQKLPSFWGWALLWNENWPLRRGSGILTEDETRGPGTQAAAHRSPGWGRKASVWGSFWSFCSYRHLQINATASCLDCFNQPVAWSSRHETRAPAITPPRSHLAAHFHLPRPVRASAPTAPQLQARATAIDCSSSPGT